MKMRYSKWIVTFVISLNVIFATAVLYIFLQIGDEPSTLITAWFAFTTGELWALSGIKRKEIEHSKHEVNNYEELEEGRDTRGTI